MWAEGVERKVSIGGWVGCWVDEKESGGYLILDNLRHL